MRRDVQLVDSLLKNHRSSIAHSHVESHRGDYRVVSRRYVGGWLRMTIVLGARSRLPSLLWISCELD